MNSPVMTGYTSFFMPSEWQPPPHPEAIGSWWREQQFHNSPSGPLGASSLPMPLRVIADAEERDVSSGKAFLRGFYGAEGPAGSFDVDSRPFSGSFGPSCPEVSSEEKHQLVTERLLEFPEEADFPALLQRMWQLMGPSAAGDWTNWPCDVDEASGKLTGPCSAAHSFSERFMMEWGAGERFAWGRGHVSEIAELIRAHIWYRNVQHGAPKLVAREQASIFAALLSELQSPHSGTTIFMGHDTQMNALTTGLGLSWRPTPFPDSAMMPASAIHLRRIGDVVEAEYLYIPNPSILSGELMRVPATFQSSGEASLPLTSFTNLAETAYNPSCANSPPRHRPAALFSWDFINSLVYT